MNYRVSRLLSLPCALAVLAGGGALSYAADQTATAQTAPVDGQARLKGALARLDLAAPKMDAATHKILPQIRTILTRVCLHPERGVTPTEQKIIAPFLPSEDGTRGLFDDAKQAVAAKDVQVVVQQAEQNNAAIQFIASQDSVPGGDKKGIVLLKNPQLPSDRTLVEIPSGTSRLPVEQRAKVVAQRLQSVHDADPMWISNLDVKQMNGQWVVSVNGSNDAKETYVITADKEFARLQGTTPEALASKLWLTIRNTVDPTESAVQGRDLVPDSDLKTPAEKLERSNLHRQEGDNFYSHHKLDRARSAYKQAIDLTPSYSIPYLRLADLYVEQNKLDKAKDILQQGLAVTDMGATEKSAISDKLKAINEKFASTGHAVDKS